MVKFVFVSLSIYVAASLQQWLKWLKFEVSFGAFCKGFLILSFSFISIWQLGQRCGQRYFWRISEIPLVPPSTEIPPSSSTPRFLPRPSALGWTCLRRFILDVGLADQRKVPFFWAVHLFDSCAKWMRYCAVDDPMPETAPLLQVP